MLFKLIFIAYGLFITYASVMPTVPSTVNMWDKLAHTLAYAVFAGLGYLAVTRQRQYWYLCLGIIAYGAAMELAQGYIPGREMSALDLVANTLGVALGMVSAQVLWGAIFKLRHE